MQILRKPATQAISECVGIKRKIDYSLHYLQGNTGRAKPLEVIQPGRPTRSSFTERLSRMTGNFPVRFSGGDEAARPLTHPIEYYMNITQGETNEN